MATLRAVLKSLVGDLNAGTEPPCVLDDGATDWYPETLLDELESTGAGQEDLSKEVSWLDEGIFDMRDGWKANRLYTVYPADVFPGGEWVRHRD
jgi:hypothetical protein